MQTNVNQPSSVWARCVVLYTRRSKRALREFSALRNRLVNLIAAQRKVQRSDDSYGDMRDGVHRAIADGTKCWD